MLKKLLGKRVEGGVFHTTSLSILAYCRTELKNMHVQKKSRKRMRGKDQGLVSWYSFKSFLFSIGC